MKTGNFPGKMDSRRRGAIERMEVCLKSIKDPDKKKRLEECIENTKANLVDNARNVRTKANRSVLGKRDKYGK